MVEQQLRRYFIGVISFGFIVTWIAIGAITAFLALLTAFAAMVVVPALLGSRRGQSRSRRPAPQRRPVERRVTTRPLADEDEQELPLVPDEPSLIIGVSS